MLVVLAATTSTAKAHWIKTPYEIHRLKSVSQQIKAYELNIAHSRRAVNWYRRNRTIFSRNQSAGEYLKQHRYVINRSRAAIAKLIWQTRPPHYSGWLCIHRYEGSWQDSGDPFWGGLQMDREFMQTYAPRWLLNRGFANVWTPLEQMWVAEQAHNSRGYTPWPNTARMCGLL